MAPTTSGSKLSSSRRLGRTKAIGNLDIKAGVFSACAAYGTTTAAAAVPAPSVGRLVLRRTLHGTRPPKRPPIAKFRDSQCFLCPHGRGDHLRHSVLEKNVPPELVRYRLYAQVLAYPWTARGPWSGSVAGWRYERAATERRTAVAAAAFSAAVTVPSGLRASFTPTSLCSSPADRALVPDTDSALSSASDSELDAVELALILRNCGRPVFC